MKTSRLPFARKKIRVTYKKCIILLLALLAVIATSVGLLSRRSSINSARIIQVTYAPATTKAPEVLKLNATDLEDSAWRDRQLSSDTSNDNSAHRDNHHSTNASRSISLSREGVAQLAELVSESIEHWIDDVRARRWKLRRQHASENAIAPIRGCFVSLIRHSEDGVKKFHRLLVNVRQMMPLMSGQYPFVAFHESAAASTAIAHLLLRDEFEFQQKHEDYKGSVRSHQAEMEAVGLTSAAEVDEKGPLADVESLSERILGRVPATDMPVLLALLKRFVFPKTITHPNPRVRDKERRSWPYDAGDASGLLFSQLPPDDFGVTPSHIHGGHWPYPQNSYWGVSYRHMCRFFGIRIFFTPFFQTHVFDYYLRLDTDSYILAAPMRVARKSELSAGNGTAAPTYVAQELDYFQVMFEKKGHYGFSMLHPQTIDQFKAEVWETYDDFLNKENADKFKVEQSVEKHGGRVGRGTSKPLLRPLSELPFPRRDLVHYWDNFEIVDLAVFRERKYYEQQARERAEDVEKEQRSRESRVAGLQNKSSFPFWYPSDDAVGIFPLHWSTQDFDIIPTDHLEGDALYQQFENSSSFADWLRNAVESDTTRGSDDATRSSRLVVAPRGAVVSVESIRELVKEELSRSSTVSSAARMSLRRKFDATVKWHNERLRLIKDWFAMVEAKGGFYYHRWGDAEIRTLTVSLFFNASTVLYCDSLPYQHYFNFQCPLSSIDNTLEDIKSDIPPTVIGRVEQEREKCEAEARKGYGEGSKSRGSARMMPAEGSHYNHAFNEHRKHFPGAFPQA